MRGPHGSLRKTADGRGEEKPSTPSLSQGLPGAREARRSADSSPSAPPALLPLAEPPLLLPQLPQISAFASRLWSPSSLRPPETSRPPTPPRAPSCSLVMTVPPARASPHPLSLSRRGRHPALLRHRHGLQKGRLSCTEQGAHTEKRRTKSQGPAGSAESAFLGRSSKQIHFPFDVFVKISSWQERRVRFRGDSGYALQGKRMAGWGKVTGFGIR